MDIMELKETEASNGVKHQLGRGICVVNLDICLASFKVWLVWGRGRVVG